MVNAVIPISKNELVDDCDYRDIDSFIDDLISMHKHNSELMNLLTLEASSLSTSVESRSKEIEEQNWLSRKFNDLTGKNSKLTARNQQDLARSQYLGQQTLNKLAENNLMTYQMVVVLGDKLNGAIGDINNTKADLAELRQTLTNFFSSLRLKLDEKHKEFKRNDDLLFWKETIAHEPIYKGKTYKELSLGGKIVCLANEFYRLSHQKWNSRDLSFLKSIYVEIGCKHDESFALNDLFESFINDEDLLSQLFLEIESVIDWNCVTLTTPNLFALKKLHRFTTNEVYIIDTFLEVSPKTPKTTVLISLLEKYLGHNFNINLKQEVTCFEVTMNLVEELMIYNCLRQKSLPAFNERIIEAEELKKEQRALTELSHKLEIEEQIKALVSSPEIECKLMSLVQDYTYGENYRPIIVEPIDWEVPSENNSPPAKELIAVELIQCPVLMPVAKAVYGECLPKGASITGKGNAQNVLVLPYGQRDFDAVKLNDLMDVEEEGDPTKILVEYIWADYDRQEIVSKIVALDNEGVLVS